MAAIAMKQQEIDAVTAAERRLSQLVRRRAKEVSAEAETIAEATNLPETIVTEYLETEKTMSFAVAVAILDAMGMRLEMYAPPRM